MITGKLLKSLNQDILIEHWIQVPVIDDNSPSNKRFLIQKCRGCIVNDSNITHSGFFLKALDQLAPYRVKKELLLSYLTLKNLITNLQLLAYPNFTMNN